jgi:hypothetical protein
MSIEPGLDRQIHDEIMALMVKANGSPKHYRKPVPSTSPAVAKHKRDVPRDEIVNACINRAAATKLAIVKLIDLGFGDDAMTLARSLLELVANTAWMLSGQNWPFRLDHYWASYELYRQRLARAAPFHRAHESDIQAAAAKFEAGVAAEVASFFNSRDTWPWALSDERIVVALSGALKELMGKSNSEDAASDGGNSSGEKGKTDKRTRAARRARVARSIPRSSTILSMPI